MATHRPNEPYTPTSEAITLATEALQSFADEGIIPSRKVNVYYKQSEKLRQEKILDALAKEAQDLDLGY